MAQTRVLVAVDPATGARITRRTARTYVAVVVTGDPAQGQAHAQGWCGRPDLAARALAKWEGRCNARLAPVVEDPWADVEAAPVVAEPEAEAVAHLCHKFPVSTPATWAPAVARLRARGAAVTVGAILRETERPGPVPPGEPAPVVAEPEAVERLGFATFNPETEGISEALPPDCYPPVTRRVRPGVTDDLDVINRSLSRAGATPLPTRRPVLPGEPEPVAGRVAEPGPVTLPGENREAVATLRADAAAGRRVSLASLARALSGAPELPTRFGGGGFAGRQPWDPGTPDARARVALQGERVATLWPIAQAVRGAGFDLPPAWWPDGPVMAGERTCGEALAALPLGAIAAAAAALAALPPVTAAQDRALRLCRGEAVGV